MVIDGLGTRVGLVVAGLSALAADARAQSLDVRGWLEQPGVRVLAVEFYATWCKPCMEAVPKWKALHDRYRSRGLRLVVVSTQDPEGGCASPGWTPDDLVCDDDGFLAKRFGAGRRLPAAFLWSWQGNLLVDRGHVEDAERELTAYLDAAPRLAVEVRDVAPNVGVDAAELGVLLASEVGRSAKITVIGTAAERARLERAQARGLAARYGDAPSCETSSALSTYSVLGARVYQRRGVPRLHLGLLSAERGCFSATSVVRWLPEQPAVAIG